MFQIWQMEGSCHNTASPSLIHQTKKWQTNQILRESTEDTRDSARAKFLRITWSEWFAAERPLFGTWVHSTDLLCLVNQQKSNHFPPLSPWSKILRGRRCQAKISSDAQKNSFWSYLCACLCAWGSGFNKSLYTSQTIKMLKTHKYVAYLLEFFMS